VNGGSSSCSEQLSLLLSLVTAVILIVADVIGESHGSPVTVPDAASCAR
jgi:hypothetical protein